MILVTGTYPPERCGVADYSARLLETQTAKETGWKLAHTRETSLGALRKNIKMINALNDDVINIQYPSMGYAKSIMPHLLCMYYRIFTRKTVSVTIHEYSMVGWKAFLFEYIFLFFAHKLIFTNQYERAYAIKYVPWVKSKSTIIKIFSNIPQSTQVKPMSERDYEIGYFGYIIPRKGLEEFIEVVDALKKSGVTINKSYILGMVMPEFKEYGREIISKAEACGIAVYEGCSDQKVADTLASTKIAFLPFPDGLSERRGSFLACIKNGMYLVSKEGQFVTEQMRKSFTIVSSSEEAMSRLKNLLYKNNEELSVLQEKVNDYVKSELPVSWDEVVKQYNDYLL